MIYKMIKTAGPQPGREPPVSLRLLTGRLLLARQRGAVFDNAQVVDHHFILFWLTVSLSLTVYFWERFAPVEASVGDTSAMGPQKVCLNLYVCQKW